MKQNLFHVWLGWLKDLGGTYEPVRDLDEPKTHKDGRRNPDTKPRQYDLNGEDYQIDKRGVITRR